MITKLDRLQGRDIYENTALAKLNEVIDAINNQQIQLNNHECRLLDLHRRITVLDDPTYHEEPADLYAEQNKWIGKLCWFWDEDTEENKRCKVLSNIRPSDDYKYYDCDYIKWKHCEPVSPEDDIIYKGGDNEK